MSVYYEGQTIEVRCLISDPDTGVAIDPTTVICTVKSPRGALTSPSVQKRVPGSYAASVLCSEDGVWSYRFEGTGTRIAVDEGRFFVRNSSVL